MPRQRILTRSEAQQWETKQFQKPRTSASLSPKELNAKRKASGQSTKPKSKATLTKTEKASWETKQFQKPVSQPSSTPATASKPPAVSGGGQPPAGKPPTTTGTGSAGKPPMPRGGTSVVPRVGSASRVEKVVQGTAEFVRNKALPQTAKQVAKKGLGRIAAAALGPVAGAIGTGLLLGEALKGTRPARAAAEGLTNLMAKATGLETRERQMLSNNGMLRPSPRMTATAPGGTSPTVPSKTMQEAPKSSTPKGSSSPARKSAPKPSQKATGASKGQGKAMKGAELANFLGLSADSAVRTYMETGKHKYPSKKK